MVMSAAAPKDKKMQWDLKGTRVRTESFFAWPKANARAQTEGGPGGALMQIKYFSGAAKQDKDTLLAQLQQDVDILNGNLPGLTRTFMFDYSLLLTKAAAADQPKFDSYVTQVLASGESETVFTVGIIDTLGSLYRREDFSNSALVKFGRNRVPRAYVPTNSKQEFGFYEGRFLHFVQYIFQPTEGTCPRRTKTDQRNNKQFSCSCKFVMPEEVKEERVTQKFDDKKFFSDEYGTCFLNPVDKCFRLKIETCGIPKLGDENTLEEQTTNLEYMCFNPTQ